MKLDTLWSMTTTIREAERIPAFLKTAKEIENEELLFLRFDKDHQLSLVRRENKGEESIILTNLLTTNFEVYGHLDSYQILSVKY